MLVDTTATNLPAWSQYFSFYASLALTIVALFAALYRAARRAELELRLTREVFFRWIDSGEALFANVVLLARNSPILIEAAQFTLRKIDGAEKSYPIEILNVGEKARGEGVIAKHYFHTTSPVTFVPVDNPQRQTYMCVLAGYTDDIRIAVETFRTSVRAIRDREGGPAIVKTLGEEKLRLLVAELQALIDKACASYMEAAQLEAGVYTLTLSIRYRRTAARVRVPRQVESSVRFAVTKGIRDRVRAELAAAFETMAGTILTDEFRQYAYPEYTPATVEEL